MHSAVDWFVKYMMAGQLESYVKLDELQYVVELTDRVVKPARS